MATQTALPQPKLDSIRNMMQFRKNPIPFMLEVASQSDEDIVHVPFAAAKEGIYDCISCVGTRNIRKHRNPLILMREDSKYCHD